MPLGMEVGLSPGGFVLHEDPAYPPPRKKGAEPPIFGPRLSWPNGCCMDQDALGTEIGLVLVLDEDPATPPLKGHAPVFGQCPLWPNGWME